MLGANAASGRGSRVAQPVEEEVESPAAEDDGGARRSGDPTLIEDVLPTDRDHRAQLRQRRLLAGTSTDDVAISDACWRNVKERPPLLW